MFADRQSDDVRIEITPLIDVVFLLLIFFVVTTQFSETPAVEIELPSTEGSPTRQDRQATRLAVDADGGLWLDFEQVTLETLESALVDRLSGVEPGDRTVYLEADRHANWEVMSAVFAALRESGATGIVAPTGGELLLTFKKRRLASASPGTTRVKSACWELGWSTSRSYEIPSTRRNAMPEMSASPPAL